MVLLEADSKIHDSRYSDEDLRIWYSNAFTRFLNYVHSLTRSQCSMYGAAQELGINTFIVDLRHLCAHGNSLPSLEIFKRCSSSCKNWLKQFYWDHLVAGVHNVQASDLTDPKLMNLKKEFEFLLEIYDFVAEQIRLRVQVLHGVADLPNPVRQYMQSLENDNLLEIRGQVLKDLTTILENQSRDDSDVEKLFCSCILQKMVYFMTTTPVKKRERGTVAVTVVHQNLFHTLANFGLIPRFISQLIHLYNADNCEAAIKIGALFWTYVILKTCVAIRDIKQSLLKDLDPERCSKINWNSINTKSLDSILENEFKERKMTRENSLLFGVSVRCPWSLEFGKKFVEEQILKTSLDNSEINVRLLEFVKPPLDDLAKKKLEHLIKLYASQFEESNDTDDLSAMDLDLPVQDVVELAKEPVDWGIWSAAEPGIKWGFRPLGVLPWQDE